MENFLEAKLITKFELIEMENFIQGMDIPLKSKNFTNKQLFSKRKHKTL
jgi:hypothetical protein